MRTIEERTDFLRAVRFNKVQQDEIERVDDWVMDNHYTPAQYIVWLEEQMATNTNGEPQ